MILPSLSRRGVKAYLWLFWLGLHKTMMTIRMMENRRCQNASSIHRSRQSGKITCFAILDPIKTYLATKSKIQARDR